MMLARRSVLMAEVLFTVTGCGAALGPELNNAMSAGTIERLFDFPGDAVRAAVQGRGARTTQRGSVLTPQAR